MVGLGESTHGTREFFQFKERLVRFLVTELGFNVVAIEAGLADMEPLNEYIVEGTGTLSAALATQGYIAYNNEDFVRLMAWLRAHNRRLPVERRVQVVGLDIMTNTRGRARVLDYLRAHDPRRVQEVESVFRTLAEEQAKTPLSFSRERLNSVLPQLNALHEFLKAERTRLASTNNVAQLETLIRYTKQMVWWSGGTADDGTPVGRSRAMGFNVLEILSHRPGAKVIAWAFNSHVARRSSGATSIGTEVSKVVGDRYYGMAFEFGQGVAQVRPPDTQGQLGPLQQMQVPAAPFGSLPWLLSEVTAEDFFVDLRSGHTTDVKRWLEQPIPAHWVAWNQQPGKPTVANDTVGDYDGLFFVHRASAARPTKAAKQQAASGGGI
ncbi:erythromycin esterase family protein [Luteitalea pratensis]|uniref:erythromycin esterase family protein n=1 Tax=Luteitalea pratensis TaxID=1855912 RepID=UPI0012FFB625|nr:erythromycin esterase family protein [Luteitalea pratensis]